MERGLYAAATGMIAQQNIQDLLAQNLANAGTVGYKQDSSAFRALHGMMISRLQNGMGSGPQIGELGSGVALDQVSTDWENGVVANTGQPLDASLAPGQFFSISTPVGERYTRAGNFQLDGNGNLVTASGQPVLDVNNKPITAPAGQHISLDDAGNLLAGTTPIARLKIVQIDPNSLAKMGNSLYAATNPATVKVTANPQLRPQTLEQSNVNPVACMVQLMSVNRSFDMAQRAIVTQDEMTKHATTEIGRIG